MPTIFTDMPTAMLALLKGPEPADTAVALARYFDEGGRWRYPGPAGTLLKTDFDEADFQTIDGRTIVNFFKRHGDLCHAIVMDVPFHMTLRAGPGPHGLPGVTMQSVPEGPNKHQLVFPDGLVTNLGLWNDCVVISATMPAAMHTITELLPAWLREQAVGRSYVARLPTTPPALVVLKGGYYCYDRSKPL
jgi:hypothetical protein